MPRLENLSQGPEIAIDAYETEFIPKDYDIELTSDNKLRLIGRIQSPATSQSKGWGKYIKVIDQTTLTGPRGIEYQLADDSITGDGYFFTIKSRKIGRFVQLEVDQTPMEGNKELISVVITVNTNEDLRSISILKTLQVKNKVAVFYYKKPDGSIYDNEIHMTSFTLGESAPGKSIYIAQTSKDGKFDFATMNALNSSKIIVTSYAPGTPLKEIIVDLETNSINVRMLEPEIFEPYGTYTSFFPFSSDTHGHGVVCTRGSYNEGLIWSVSRNSSKFMKLDIKPTNYIYQAFGSGSNLILIKQYGNDYDYLIFSLETLKVVQEQTRFCTNCTNPPKLLNVPSKGVFVVEYIPGTDNFQRTSSVQVGIISVSNDKSTQTDPISLINTINQTNNQTNRSLLKRRLLL